jgi:hypothetical protein
VSVRTLICAELVIRGEEILGYDRLSPNSKSKLMTYTKEICVDILSDDEYVEMVKVDFELTKENSGIGSYEYFGFRGYDSGSDYYECDGYSWDESLYSPKQNKAIERVLDNQYKSIIEKINEELKKQKWEP